MLSRGLNLFLSNVKDIPSESIDTWRALGFTFGADEQKPPKEKHKTGVPNILFVGAEQLHRFDDEEFELVRKFKLQRSSNIYTRISFINGNDVYSTNYFRVSEKPSHKDSSFFLYKVNFNGKATFSNCFVGRARCYFKANNTSYCLAEKYSYFDSPHPKKHISGMYKICMAPIGLDIIPLSAIKTRVMCLHSASDPLLEEDDEHGQYSIGMVINHVHEL